MQLKKGQIVWVRLDGVGREQNGNRPCIVVQNDTGNRFSPTTIIVPLTTRKQKKTLPTHLEINGETLGRNFEDSIVLCEQIKIIDKSRIIKLGNYLSNEIVQLVDVKLIVSLGIKSPVS